MFIRFETPGLFSGSKRTQCSVSESVTARLNLRAMSSGFSSRNTQPEGSDLLIFDEGLPRPMTLAPTLGMYASGILKVSP